MKDWDNGYTETKAHVFDHRFDYMEKLAKFKNDFYEGTHFDIAYKGVDSGGYKRRHYKVISKYPHFAVCRRDAPGGSYNQAFTWPELYGYIANHETAEEPAEASA